MKNVETFSAAILSGSKWSSASSWAVHKNCWHSCSPRYHTRRQLYYIRTFVQWQGKNEKKLIGFALLYVIVCTHYVCGVVYVSPAVISVGISCITESRGGRCHVSGEGIPNIISWWWCTQVQATVQTENLTASCVLNGEISLINVKIGYRIHKDK